MRISEIIHVLNRTNLPSEKEFKLEYSYISHAEAKEIRKLHKIKDNQKCLKKIK